MLPIVSRHVIFPLHELLLKRRTPRYVRELEHSQWLAPTDMRTLQRAKLGALLRHAATTIPFYRGRMKHAGVDVDHPHPFETLAGLPLLDKQTIRDCSDDMLWRDAPGGFFRHNTGGSTGEPLIFFFDRRRQGYDQAARIRTHRWFGVDIGDRELYIWGSPIELARGDRLKRFRDALFNHRLLNAFHMSPERTDDYVKEFHRFRPSCLFGYPSSMALFAGQARERGHRLESRHLRAVFVTGEVCHPHQRKIITEAFGVPVVDGYGSREAGFIAHECPIGNMHITAESVFIEIAGENGKVLPVGQTGEIVVTHLDAYAMPFIRYRTGDVGRLKPGRCACGRGLPLMDVIQGRTTDFLYLPNGTVRHALSIIYPLRDLPGVRQFRVTQNEDFSVMVDVVADDKAGKITREAVTRSVRPVVGDVELSVSFVDGIATPSSGKHHYVVSHAGPRSRSSSEESDG